MKFLKRWLLLFFPKKEKEQKILSNPQDENLLLKIKIAELENSIIQLSEIIQKTSETIVILQDNITKANKISQAGLNLAQQHEDIFKKIMEDKLLVFGLTKKTRIVKPEDPEPKSD